LQKANENAEEKAEASQLMMSPLDQDKFLQKIVEVTRATIKKEKENSIMLTADIF